MQDKNEYQAELLSNRLSKRFKHLKKWAKRSNVTCYRLYDRDIPEIPLAIDLFQTETELPGETGDLYVQMALYERPYEKAEEEESEWLSKMANAVSYTLAVPMQNIIIKTRKKQRGELQYEKNSDRNIHFIVKEQGERFLINLSDYIDTGLFFDHRPLRAKVRQDSAGKTVLNLFCYTGSFSVYAATGKAKRIDSVDLSGKYLSWAKKNMKLNGFTDEERYQFIETDVVSWLKKTAAENAAGDALSETKKTYDIIILDPPTFSNSKKTETMIDINRDWPELVKLCLELLNKGGVLYFSTNSKRLAFDEALLPSDVHSRDISASTIPEDFRNTKIHRVWEITK